MKYETKYALFFHFLHICNNQGKVKEAESCVRKALEGMKKALGNSHVETADCMVSLAKILMKKV